MLRFVIVVFLAGFFSSAVAQTPVSRADSVTTAISSKYVHTNFIAKLFLGRNYRKVWATPVTFPVFHLQRTMGGFTVEKLGGGQQTKSLRLKDVAGRDWVLRTVDKEVTNALPPKLRLPFIIKVVQDMVSAAHPYAPLAVSALASATGIIAARPVFYYVPDDPALGEYRSLFAGTVCLLERREPTPDNSDTKSTAKVLDKIMEENDHLVIQKEVLRARLLDMYIADWDRHADQWRWGVVDSGDVKLYYAIPRDRDQAFFNSNGLIVKLATLVGLPHLVGFKKSLHLRKINAKSWQFDQLFLNELAATDWEKALTTFQRALSDSVVDAAVHRFPPPVYAVDGAKIKNTLLLRRDKFYRCAMDYYRFISNHVTIVGSKESEVFTVTGQGKAVAVTVTALIDNHTDTLYYRTFDPAVTQKITLRGLAGKDTFKVTNSVASPIKLYIEGGDGADVYDIQGKIRNRITDAAPDCNQLRHTSHSRLQRRK